MPKKTVKTTAKKAAPKTKSRAGKKVTVYGIEHEFVIITGGGFLVVVLALLLFF